MKEYIQAIVTILALINPMVCAGIFTDCVRNVPAAQRTREAVKAITAIGMVLFVSAFFGMSVLKTFGVSIAAFSCAGGFILVWIGAGMLVPKPEDTKHSSLSAGEKTSLTPLILFAASPGTITAVITISAAHNRQALPVTAITGVAAALAVLAVVLLLAARLSRENSPKSGMRKIVSSYMGVLIIAMGIQFVLTGIRQFME